MENVGVQSFTKMAVLNRWALDFFSPTSYDKVFLVSVNGSAYESFVNTTKDPFKNYKKPENPLYKGARLLLTTPIRVAYLAMTVLYISPLGVVCNGVRATSFLGKYSFTKNNNDLTKAIPFAHACFHDFSCALIGGFAVLLAAFGAVKVFNSTIGYFDTLAMATIVVCGVAMLIFLQTPYGAANFLANEKERCGLYLSFTLRNELGIVGKDGGLLPFSINDRFAVCGSIPNENLRKIGEMTAVAEENLIQFVHEANALGAEIDYVYPFDGETIANQLRYNDRSQSGDGITMGLSPKNPLKALEHKIRSMGHKIVILRNLYETLFDLSVNYSLPVVLLAELWQKRLPEYNIRIPNSFIPKELYQWLFRRVAGVAPPSPGTFDLWTKITIESLNPNENACPDSGSLFEKFKYDVQTNKWKSENGETPETISNLLGLRKDMPLLEIRKQKRKYRLALHPDKNKDSPDSTELFQLAFQCFEQWEKKA